MIERSTYALRPALFADATEANWADWHWQQQNRIRDLSTLESLVDLTTAEREAFHAASREFRVAITPHYAALISESDPACPLRRQAIPQPGELREYSFEMNDPLAEEEHMPVPGLTHRYPDRALLYASHNCPMYCRHCTRKRKVADPTSAASRADFAAALDYIERTPAVRDVIISGGDPLTLSDERLAELLESLSSISHVEVIRVGTRNPVTLPQRITPALCDIFRAAGPIYVHTHFNHPRELSTESVGALERLRNAGCVLGNQMVLLRDVNDDPTAVMKLNRELLKLGCRPYYILQCDMAPGITHFRTPLERGLEIMDHLRGRIGGMGVPHFVVDLPGGGGKVELLPDYIESIRTDGGRRTITFRNYEGDTYAFVDVASHDGST